MRLPLFALLFAAALVATFVVFSVGMRRNSDAAARLVLVVSAGAIVLWGVTAMSAFEVVTVSNGTEFQNSYPSLAVLSALGGAANLFALYQSAIRTLDV